MIKKITAFQIHTTGEGERATFTYSIINEDGVVINQNKRAEIILVDDDMLDKVNDIYRFLKTKIPE